MSCEPCAVRAAGEDDRAEAIESIRSQRLVLDILNGAADATAEIFAEFGDCHECTVRLAARYLTMTAQSLVYITGSVGAAGKAVGRGLLEDLDRQQG